LDNQTIHETITMEITDELNTLIRKPYETDFSSKIKVLFEKLETILSNYLLVLPTINNPASSRAFTIVNVLLQNGSSISFIDLPGLEKKTTMIRDHYMEVKPNTEIKSIIEAKQKLDETKKTRAEKKVTSTSNRNSRTETEMKIIGPQLGTTANSHAIFLGYTNEGWRIEPKDLSDYFVYIVTELQTGTSKTNFIEFRLNEDGAKELNNIKQHTNLQKYVTVLLKMLLNFDYKHNSNMFATKKEYGVFCSETALKLLCYVNYTEKFLQDYTYRIETKPKKLSPFLQIFKSKFMDNSEYIEYEENTEIKSSDEKIIFTKTFDTLYPQTLKNVFGLNIPSTIPSTITSVFNDATRQLPYYKSPALTCLHRLLRELQKKANSEYSQLLYVIKFTDFTIKQGGKIVSSLDHLLYRFLDQIPGGLDKYNNNNDDLKYDDNYITKTTEKIMPADKDELEATGMTETLYRKYCNGMDHILNLGTNINKESGAYKNTQYLTLLAMVRNEKSEAKEQSDSIKNKRCQGAIDTVKFAKTLVQAPDDPSCGETIKKDLKVMSEKQKQIQTEIDTILNQLPNNDDASDIDKKAIEAIKNKVTDLKALFQSE
jgi:hypothetical protein